MKSSQLLPRFLSVFAVALVLALNLTACSDTEETAYTFAGSFKGIRTLANGEPDSIKFVFVQGGTRNNLLTGMITCAGKSYEIGNGRVEKNTCSFFTVDDTLKTDWVGTLNNTSDQISGHLSSSKQNGGFTAVRQ